MPKPEEPIAVRAMLPTPLPTLVWRLVAVAVTVAMVMVTVAMVTAARAVPTIEGDRRIAP